MALQGEHIDYSNFPVLPMAIAPDILIAIHIDPKDQSHKITLQNTNPRFAKREIHLDTSNPTEPVTIDSKTLGPPSLVSN
jgi:galactokinase